MENFNSTATGEGLVLILITLNNPRNGEQL
jgi:hypothetical protein